MGMQQGTPDLGSCSTSSSASVGERCWCSDDEQHWCEPGMCCWPGRECRKCEAATPAPTLAPATPETSGSSPVLYIVLAAVFGVVLVAGIFACHTQRKRSR